MSHHHTPLPSWACGLPTQAAALFVLALALTLAFNGLRPDPLPSAEGLAPIRAARAKAQGVPPLTVRQALELMAAGQARFLDARDPAAFRNGAIPGAVNLPPGLPDAELAARLAALPRERVLVAYCDGLGCDLSRTLAERLAALGAARVALLADGLDGWLKAGGPLEVHP
jgi:rhodanese-related sulfurtransferase